MASQYTSLRNGIKMKNRSWRSLCLDTWFPEIVATLFSIICFIAISCILFAYNQEIRPELHYGLSLNAIISVLATGCKSSLIFVIGEAMGQLKWTWFYAKPNKLLDIQTLDSASRGPLGSIATLFHKPRRSLASLGAAVIILLLVFDPFIQQIISYPTRLTARHGGINVPTTKKLDYFAPAIDYFSVYSTGFWSEDTMLSPSCPLGNCTWTKFQSSGMCSQCSDITKSMDLKCETTQSINSSYSEGEHYKNETVTCHLAPPQGKSTQFDVNFYTLWEDSSPNPVGLDYTTSGISWHVFSAYGRSLQYRRQTGDEPFTWPSDPLMVLGYAEIGYNEDYLDSDLSGGIRVDKVTECSLELCHLEYEVSFGNGTPHINTSVLDYGQLFWRNSSEARSKQMLCWKPTSGPPPPDIIIENVTISNDSFVRLSPVEGVFCGIEDNIILDENVFTGSTIHVHGRLRSEHGYGQDYDVMREDSDRNVLRIGSVGLDVIMSNVAGHMNKEGLARNGSDVNGIAYVTEVFVEVQWLWLILPIILVVSGTIFIVIVIIENRKNGTNLWKSSVLAFCYHGLHDVDKDDSMAASVMERKAEELIVRLQESEDHGGLVLREKKNLLEVHE